jgi:general secretion pathway protein F
VLSTGKWANENVVLLCVILLIPPLLLVTAWKQNKIRLKVLQQIERLPVVGEWITQADIASWAKVLSSLVRNRVELIVALDLSVASIRMPNRKRRLEKAKSAVKAGTPLSTALEENNCLNETGYNLIRVGERSGKVESMLNALAELYTEQGKQRMKQVLKLIEPIAILIIGLGMGIIITGIMLAITSANDIAI